jgi:YebC/PmpR family DNA-binding regulatory protein
MAKHSHWDNIKHKKAANDKKKAAVISKMGVILTIAVQAGGPKQEDNPRLRLAVAKARSAGMNMDAIERAIAKASGQGANGKVMDDLMYEGYAAGGVALVVMALTDNRNRTAPEIKKLFERAGSAMGAPGCVSWQFKDKSVFLVAGGNEDKVMEVLLEAGCDVEDVTAAGDNQVSVTAAANQFDAVTKALVAAKLTVVSSDITKIPDNMVEITNLETAKAVQAFVDALDEHDDVQGVYHNAQFSDEIAAAL